jgi:hypothetical protein
MPWAWARRVVAKKRRGTLRNAEMTRRDAEEE